MPQTIPCDSDDGNPALFLITNMETGDTLNPCVLHAADTFRALADAFAAIPDQEPAPEPTVGAAPGEEGEAAPNPPRPKSGQDGHEAAPKALTSQASPFPDATPIDS